MDRLPDALPDLAGKTHGRFHLHFIENPPAGDWATYDAATESHIRD